MARKDQISEKVDQERDQDKTSEGRGTVRRVSGKEEEGRLRRKIS